MSKGKAAPPSKDEASVLIEAVILCDQVRREDNQKLFFIGTYTDQVNVSTLPFMISLTVVVAARVMQPGPFHFQLSITDPLGQRPVELLQGEGSYEGEPGRIAWLPIQLPPFMMAAEGPYVISLEIADSSRNERFHVQKIVSQALQVRTSPAPN